MIAVLLTVIAIDRLAPMVLPANVFYFRPWSYILGHHGMRRTNASITIPKAYGDLGNLLGVPAYYEPRTLTFTADEYGFRNPIGTSRDADIVLVGQSFMTGSGNDDLAIPAAQLRKKVDQSVYSYTPGNMSDYLLDPNFLSNPPRIVVWGLIERNMLGSNEELRRLANMQNCSPTPLDNPQVATLKNSIKRFVFQPSEYLRRSIVRLVSSRLYKRTRYHFTGTHDPAVTISPHADMLFLTKSIGVYNRTYDERSLEDVLSTILIVHNCLQQRGSTLVFLPIPDKTNVYDILLPGEHFDPEKSPPIVRLAKEINQKGASAVDLYTPFRQAEKRLYWKDDTHWNEDGIALMIDILVKDPEMLHFFLVGRQKASYHTGWYARSTSAVIGYP